MMPPCARPPSATNRDLNGRSADPPIRAIVAAAWIMPMVRGFFSSLEIWLPRARCRCHSAFRQGRSRWYCQCAETTVASATTSAACSARHARSRPGPITPPCGSALRSNGPMRSRRSRRKPMIAGTPATASQSLDSSRISRRIRHPVFPGVATVTATRSPSDRQRNSPAIPGLRAVWGITTHTTSAAPDAAALAARRQRDSPRRHSWIATPSDALLVTTTSVS
jgi:hypothetical protein